MKLQLLLAYFCLFFFQSSYAQVKKQTLLINRIGPSSSKLYIANRDGSGAKLLYKNSFDYNARFSFDGNKIVFTSERDGLGQSEIYMSNSDGSNVKRITQNNAFDDQASFSPDGNNIVFVSDREGGKANIWIMNLETKKLKNLTSRLVSKQNLNQPQGFYKPSWSPDGKWVAFSSDINTTWKGHSNNKGWEHLQQLDLYIMSTDGLKFKQITKDFGVSGSPVWSHDSKKLIFYNMPLENSWYARLTYGAKKVSSQIYSVDIDSLERSQLTTNSDLKLAPHIDIKGNLSYLKKYGLDSNIIYSNTINDHFPKRLREPHWSIDGKKIIYEVVDFTPRKQFLKFFSWINEFDIHYTDVFPQFNKDGLLVVTNKDVNSSILTMHADGSFKKIVYNTGPCQNNESGPCSSMGGVAFAPSWSPQGDKITFGYGGYLVSRTKSVAKIMLVNSDGTSLEELTSGKPNAGFPSFSPDGNEIVYRVWGDEYGEGLRILNLKTKKVRVLTKGQDNLPGWSVKNKIVFTRRFSDTNYDIFTINPDGSGLKRVTKHPSSDAHAVWSFDGKYIMWNSARNGFKDEAAYYDNSFQPYGQVWIMDADGKNKRWLTDSKWEDSMPAIVPPYAL